MEKTESSYAENKEVQWIRLNWALNRFRLAWAYINWTTEPIQAEQMQSVRAVQLRYTLAGGSLSAGRSTKPPGQPLEMTPSRGRGKGHFAPAQGELLSGSLPMISPSASLKIQLRLFLVLFFFFFLKSFSYETGVGGCSQDFRWLGGRRANGWLRPFYRRTVSFSLTCLWCLTSVVLLLPF